MKEKIQKRVADRKEVETRIDDFEMVQNYELRKFIKLLDPSGRFQQLKTVKLFPVINFS